MFDRWFEVYRWWWCALTGLLLVLCFAPFACATCGWIALVPAWWVISRSPSAHRRPMRYGYLIGLIYFGGVFWWISNVTAIGTFFLVLYLALYPAFWFLFVARLVLRDNSPEPKPFLQTLVEAFAAASLWVLLEWWRSWFLTGFNWDELGASQATSVVFRQLAAFGGVHLLSFILVVANILWAEGLIAIAENIREKRVVRASPPFAAALFLVAVCFAVGWTWRQNGARETTASLRFACVQPNIPQIPYDGGPVASFFQREDDALKEIVRLSKVAIVGKPDLLIWPEAMIDQGVFEDRPMNEAVHDISMSFDGSFLLGSQSFENKHPYNCAYLFTPHFEEYDYYQKTRLVILGEFLPFAESFPALHEKLRKTIHMGMDFTPGPGPKLLHVVKPRVTFAPLICFEDTLAVVADQAAALKPDFFITITNDGWYTGWSAEWGIRQHLNLAIFRCVEHDRAMLRCANTGISCVIDPSGAVIDRYRDAAGREIDTGGIFSGQLEIRPARATPYEALGDWIVLISAAVGVMLTIRLVCRRFVP